MDCQWSKWPHAVLAALHEHEHDDDDDDDDDDRDRNDGDGDGDDGADDELLQRW